MMNKKVERQNAWDNSYAGGVIFAFTLMKK